MAQLTFPITGFELKLPVVVGPNRKALLAQLAAGQALPAPVWTDAVVDTGSNVTCVSLALVRRLRLAPTGQSGSHTVGGQVAANLFEVSLSRIRSGWTLAAAVSQSYSA
jgi:hypothetical protein